MEFGVAALNTKSWLRSQCLFINDACCQMSDGDMNDVTCVFQMILNGLNVIDCVETDAIDTAELEAGRAKL